MYNFAHQILKNKQEIIHWLECHDIKNYHLIEDEENDNWKVNVNDNVDLSKRNLSYLAVQFGDVKGHFDCSFNQLISLKGVPRLVEESFNCQHNQLKTLKYAPRIVMTNFNCSMNFELKNLNKGPNVVGRNYICKNTSIEFLEDFYTIFHGDFYHCIWEKNQQNLIEDFEDYYIEAKQEKEWGKKLKMNMGKKEIETILLKNKMQKELSLQNKCPQYKM